MLRTLHGPKARSRLKDSSTYRKDDQLGGGITESNRAAGDRLAKARCESCAASMDSPQPHHKLQASLTVAPVSSSVRHAARLMAPVSSRPGRWQSEYDDVLTPLTAAPERRGARREARALIKFTKQVSSMSHSTKPRRPKTSRPSAPAKRIVLQNRSARLRRTALSTLCMLCTRVGRLTPELSYKGFQ